MESPRACFRLSSGQVWLWSLLLSCILFHACPPDYTSAHQKSCSKYNSRMFSGRQFLWEPFIHPTSPCLVSCRAVGKHFYANLADNLQDGAPCGSELNNSICVQGVCMVLGCDGVVGSTAVKDSCSVCNGDGSSCRTISGIFTSTTLKRGTHYVLSLPSGSTNINITQLGTSTNMLLLRTADDNTITNNDTKSSLSGTIEAAGTIFRYEAGSSSSRRETITSHGPTNITVVLQLLVRGVNLGILYTFSVPQGVSENVIQQIRHHSKHAERPLEYPSNRSRQGTVIKDGNSTSSENYDTKSSLPELIRNDHLMRPIENINLFNTEVIKASHSRTFSTNYSKPLIEEQTERRVSEPGNGSQSQTKHPVSEPGNGSQSQTDNFAHRGLDNASTDKSGLHIQDKGHNSIGLHEETDLLTIPRDHPDHHMRSSSIHLGHILTYNSTVNKSKPVSVSLGNELSNFSLNTKNGFEQKDEVNGLNFGTTTVNVTNKELGGDRTQDSSQDVVDYDDSSSTYYTRLSGVERERIRNVLKDHQFRFAEDSVKSDKDEGPDESTQSVSIPLNSVVDPKEIENWDPDSRSCGRKTIINIQNYGPISSGLQMLHPKNVEVRKPKIEAENKDDLGSKFSKSSDNSETHAAGDTIYENIQKQVVNVDTVSSLHDNKYKYIADIEDGSHSQPASSVSLVDSSRFMVPKYSQSFIFAERYKNSRKQGMKGRHSQRSNSMQHEISLHNYNHRGSPNISIGASLRNVEEESNELTNINKRPSNNVNRAGSQYSSWMGITSNETQFELRNHSYTIEKSSNTERRAETKAQERQGKVNTSFPGSQNTTIEDTKLRLQEQQDLYHKRHRELRERSRQRQTGLGHSHKHSLFPGAIEANGSKSSFRNSYQRMQDNLEANYLSQSAHTGIKTFPSLRLRMHSPPFREETHSELTQTVQGNRDDNMARHSDVFSQSDPGLVTKHKHASAGIHGYNVAGVDHQIIASTPTEASKTWFSVTHIQTGKESSKQHAIPDSRPHVIVHVPHHQTSNLPRNPNFDPKIITWPRREVPLKLLVRHISNNSHSSVTHRSLDTFHNSDQDMLVDLPEQGHLKTLSAGYAWKVSGLTECTYSCGGGIQETVAVCMDSLTQAVVTDENCRDVESPKLSAVPCNKRPCAAVWTPGPWSACSVSCGTGNQARVVTCQARVSSTLNLTMPSKSCDSQEPIPDRQTCSNAPCSSWKLGTWSNCSAHCGDGFKTRHVHCVDPENNTLSDDVCTGIIPHSEEHCSSVECGKGWFVTDWTQECSADCGAGVLTRHVVCADEFRGLCDNSRRPSQTRPCRRTNVCLGSWVTGEWSQCEVKCGPGKRRRKVFCVREFSGSTASVAGDDSCDWADKPSDMESCELPLCMPGWYMTSWSECSRSCGTGYRTREVKCLGPDQSASDQCSIHTQPKETTTCNTHSCVTVVAEESAPDCADKYRKCSFVKRTSLCRFDYYKRMCCQSCADNT